MNIRRDHLKVVPLAIDPVTTAILAVGVPGDDKATVVGSDAGLALVVGGVAVDPEFVSLGDAGGIVTLAEDPPTAAVGDIVGPDDQEATVGQADQRRVVLIIAGGGVDPELGADSDAVGIEALRVEAIDTAVLTIGYPGHDVSSAAQRADSGSALIVGEIGIEAFFAKHFHDSAPCFCGWFPSMIRAACWSRPRISSETCCGAAIFYARRSLQKSNLSLGAFCAA